MKLNPRHSLVLLVACVSLSMTTCGGFGSVQKLEKIKDPKGVPKDLEKRLEVKALPKSKSLEKRRTVTRMSKASKIVSVFTLPESRKRAAHYSKTKAFRAGEKSVFALTWFAIKAGEVTMEVKPNVLIEGRETYHFRGAARSSKIMDLIHSLDDWVESYVDVETFYPLKATIEGVETDRRRKGHILFDYVNRKIHFWLKRSHVKKGIKVKRAIDDLKLGILDLFSTAFYIRTQKLEVGKTYSTDVYNEGKQSVISAKVLRKEILTTDIGDFNTVVIQPEARFQGVLKTSGDSLIWLTDDDRHFILMVRTKIKIGSLRLEIKSIDDAYYTYPSRINGNGGI